MSLSVITIVLSLSVCVIIRLFCINFLRICCIVFNCLLCKMCVAFEFLICDIFLVCQKAIHNLYISVRMSDSVFCIYDFVLYKMFCWFLNSVIKT